MSKTPQKRIIKKTAKSGMSVTALLTVAVLIAAGAVLKAFSNTIFSWTPLKPNMVIAMYCIAILLVRPRIYEAMIIGIISGIICMFLPGAVPYANIVSEFLGAFVAVILIKLPFELNIKQISFKAAIVTFLSTLVSGYTFFLMLKVLIASGMEVKDMAIAVFNTVIFGTAFVNSILALIIYPALKLAVVDRIK